MAYELIATDEFRNWYEGLAEDEQERVRRVVNLLEQAGPALRFPHSSGIKGARFSHMREFAGAASGQAVSCALRI